MMDCPFSDQSGHEAFGEAFTTSPTESPASLLPVRHGHPSRALTKMPDLAESRSSLLSNPVAVNLIAGGGAGLAEALACHPLDTLKVRMQLASSNPATSPAASRPSLARTAADILRSEEGVLAFYRGVGAVSVGIVPKMMVRFTAFGLYRDAMARADNGLVAGNAPFLAGLAAGCTEAVLVVTPMEVVKIRLQTQTQQQQQQHAAPVRAATSIPGTAAPSPQRSMSTHAAPLPAMVERRGALAIIATVFRDEGFASFYRGLGLTTLRQGSNQAVNFGAYTQLREAALRRRRRRQHPNQDTQNKGKGAEMDEVLPGYQTTLIGLVSGALGPLANNPVDTVKTRLQAASRRGAGGTQKASSAWATCREVYAAQGVAGFYRGITPRVMKVAPGQAVSFAVYEFIKGRLNGLGRGRGDREEM